MQTSTDKIIPLGDRVLIKPDEPLKTSGGIIIPEAAKKKSDRGLVLAAGEDCDVKAGDRVLFGHGAGTQIEEGVIMRESDIFATL